MNPGYAAVLAHGDTPPVPGELWSAWTWDPVVLTGLLLVAWAYLRGRSRGRGRDAERWRARFFATALVAIAIALLSPLDAVSRALASGHMVQHLLLTLVAAPLLVLSAPGPRLLRGGPAAVRRAITPWRRHLRLGVVAPLLRHPGTAWLLHVATFWAWHAAVLYDAAVENAPVHALEHATFLVTGVLFWRTIIGVRATRVPAGLGVLLVFGMAMSNALLSVLLTFGRSAWYTAYATTTHLWGLEPLADQQLAGALMWVPAGMVHVAVALALLVTWIRGTEDGEAPATPVASGQVVVRTPAAAAGPGATAPAESISNFGHRG